MALAWSGLAAVVPVALGATALGHTVYESARAGTAKAFVDDLAAATAALTALALFLLSLGALVDAREAGLVVGTAGALFLSVRVRTTPGGELLFVCIVGVLLGAQPGIGLALLPSVVSVAFATFARRDGTRNLARGALLFGAGAVVAYLAAGRDAPPHLLPTSDDLRAWSGDAFRVVGACGCALAVIGLALALTGSSPRWRLAVPTALLLVGGAATGRAGAVTVLALALGVGLALSEVATRVTSLAMPGVLTALLPLVLLVMLEPMAMRIGAYRGAFPTLGPVPPADSPTMSKSTRARSRR